MKDVIVKVTLSVFFAWLSAYFQELAAPAFILIAVMICDYLSGLFAASVNNELSSRTGLIGIIKKLCYLIIVAVGMAVDWIIDDTLLHVGVKMPEDTFIVGLIVTVWLIINELLSILENLSRSGIPIPPFLNPLLKKLKKKVEDEGAKEGDSAGDEEKKDD